MSHTFPLFLMAMAFFSGLAGANDTAYWTHGEKREETVVLIHGFNSSHATWDNLLPELSKRHHVLVIDQPGHGLSPARGKDFSPRAMADNLRDLLRKLKIEKVHLLGHSMGGRTVVAYAAAYPGGVLSTSVADMSLLPFKDAKEQLPAAIARFDRVKAEVPREFKNLPEAIAALSPFYTETEQRFILSAAEFRKDGSIRLGNRPEVTHLYLAQGLALDMTEELRTLKSPLAFFPADADDETAVLKADGIAHIERLRPDAKIWEIEGADHSVQRTPLFTRLYLAFLASFTR